MEPSRIYDRRQQAYSKLLTRQRLAADRLGNYRLFTILVGLAAALIVYRAVRPWMGIALGLVTLILFGFLAHRHQRLVARLKYTKALHEINRKGLERAAGRWGAFPESGAAFRDDAHPYASDLDLFGQGSLFQWINAAQTPLGQETLARLLKQVPGTPAEIGARQEAVAALAQKLTWRQHFEAEGLLVRDRLEPTAPLLQWAKETRETYLKPWLRLGIWVLPAVTILTVALWALNRAPWQVPALFVAIHVLILRSGGKDRGTALSMVYKFEPSLKTYAQMLGLLEGQKLGAGWLRERQGRLRDRAGRSALEQISRLSTIVERISSRQNAMFIVINVLTLWDYHCMVGLEAWKRASGRMLRTWLDVLAEVEALSSLANIRFEHPDWAMPTLVEGPGEPGGFSAEQLGHPLIAQKRVSNDFELRAPARIAVITGSNMSGKSTFLRTAGINLVLAYIGAPVCALRFRCSVMSLWTSMRVSDNLEQNVSSFYAELLRIKRIVEAARTGSPVFFLLDEIFKGTNSHDRHQGAKALIAQLQRDGTYGLISTHDLELGELERESNGRIRNFHFREYYEGQEIRFDYTLRLGVSTTRNALHLIKLVGIEVDAGT